jgi:DNA-directed RNA polymerase subunit RPC12/RpoP
MGISDKYYTWGNKRLQKLYGHTPPQYAAYRCFSCSAIITWPMIEAGAGCAKCGSIKCRPTSLSFFEEMRLLFMPWSFPVKKTEEEIPQVRAIGGGSE